MPPSFDGAHECQPLLELQQHEADATASAAGSAPQQPAAGPPPPPKSAGAAAPGSDAGAAATQPPVQRLLSDRHCRYCLQEEEPGDKLEAPCKCAGSIKWAHHGCVQHWVDEKHDKRCEICGSQFEGDYRQPAPAPAPLPHAPLVAQLQVTNDDTRIVSLADPVTGEVVARMVMGPAVAELQAEAAAAAATGLIRFQAAAAAAAAERDGGGETGMGGCLLLLLYVLAWVGLLVTIPLSVAADAGDSVHVARLVLICVVLALRIAVWPALHQQEEQQAQQRHAAAARARRLAADLETGLAPRRPHAGR